MSKIKALFDLIFHSPKQREELVDPTNKLLAELSTLPKEPKEKITTQLAKVESNLVFFLAILLINTSVMAVGAALILAGALTDDFPITDRVTAALLAWVTVFPVIFIVLFGTLYFDYLKQQSDLRNALINKQ